MVERLPRHSPERWSMVWGWQTVYTIWTWERISNHWVGVSRLDYMIKSDWVRPYLRSWDNFTPLRKFWAVLSGVFEWGLWCGLIQSSKVLNYFVPLCYRNGGSQIKNLNKSQSPVFLGRTWGSKNMKTRILTPFHRYNVYYSVIKPSNFRAPLVRALTHTAKRSEWVVVSGSWYEKTLTFTTWHEGLFQPHLSFFIQWEWVIGSHVYLVLRDGNSHIWLGIVRQT